VLESFIARWGYLAVGVGTLFEGEAVLIAGGALAHRGLLSLPLVIAASFIGSVGGDQLWFQVGRRWGRRLFERGGRIQMRAERVRAWLGRRGALFVFSFRFIYGMRTATPIALGASNYPPWRFALLNVLGGAVWAVVFGAAGWALGASLASVLQRATRVEEVLAASLGLTLAIWLAAKAIRRRQARRRA
jgi:membrane protein DedA with SNARE-associated domain